MARRQIPVHDSMLKPRAPGIMESLAEQLGVERPTDGEAADVAVGLDPDVLDDGGQAATSSDDEAPRAAPPDTPDASKPTETPARPQRRAPARGAKPALKTPRPDSVDIDARIVAAKGKQALYVRLPREMHEFLEDLSYRLSKTNRDASMTNLVAQAIADKYPDALDVSEDTE